MATYPYISSPTALAKAFEQLRKNFPPKVDAAYLKRFKIAPANESYVINILRFLGLINEDGVKQEDKTAFLLGNDDTFRAGMDAALREVYAELFLEMGDGEVYKADREDLGHWFRGADKTSDLVGKRQAMTFQALGALAGQVEAAPPRAAATRKPRAAAAAKAAKAANSTTQVTPMPPKQELSQGVPADVGLTVRIEVNLPPGGDATTYDAIFASIKRHLIP